MGELSEDLSTVAVDGLGHAGEPWQHAVIVDAHLARGVPPSCVAEHVTAEDQANPVPRQRLVDLDELVGDLARHAGGGFGCAGTDDAIGCRDLPDSAGLEKHAGGHGRRWYPFIPALLLV